MSEDDAPGRQLLRAWARLMYGWYPPLFILDGALTYADDMEFYHREARYVLSGVLVESPVESAIEAVVVATILVIALLFVAALRPQVVERVTRLATVRNVARASAIACVVTLALGCWTNLPFTAPDFRPRGEY